VTIQDLIICTVQNIEKLMRHLRRCESGAAAVAGRRLLGPVGGLSRLYALLRSCFVVMVAIGADRSQPGGRSLPAII